MLQVKHESKISAWFFALIGFAAPVYVFFKVVKVSNQLFLLQMVILWVNVVLLFQQHFAIQRFQFF